MAERCAFCPNTGSLTREHVWPLRFEKYVPKPPNSTVIYRHERGPDGRVETSHTQTTFDYKVRAVCEACNNGWMARLDGEAEPIVVALMRGHAVSLDSQSQRLLVRWGLRMAYVSEYLHPTERRHVPRAHRELIKAGSLPTETYVYGGWFKGESTGWNRLRTFDLYDGPGKRLVGKGYMLTMILGQLAIRVIGYPGAAAERKVDLSEEVAPWVKQLHPRVAPTVILPPERYVTDSDLYRFTDDLPFGRIAA